MKTNLVTASAIKEAILRGTSRRIHRLQVEEPKQQQKERVDYQVTGQTGSYYVKQLALQALQEFPDLRFNTQITVTKKTR